MTVSVAFAGPFAPTRPARVRMNDLPIVGGSSGGNAKLEPASCLDELRAVGALPERLAELQRFAEQHSRGLERFAGLEVRAGLEAPPLDAPIQGEPALAGGVRQAQVLIELLEGDRVRVEVLHRGAGFVLRSRRLSELLAELAGRLQKDERLGKAAEQCGWTRKIWLAETLGVDSTYLNVLILRLRQQFRRWGFADAQHVVEGRSPSRAHQEVRLGVGSVLLR